ncbi:MFS transporter [Paenibacillus sp. N4]|uniref:MFS transporter n=1 Tax=Paenibacillus vietnamensis TaxID=2590547 RepID=UPI001CD12415|nr:MFS transporter [Paenibacillus vietnamensis]MCA0757852.1 MFS transporter [Paenibacillus vietnamensis]
MTARQPSPSAGMRQVFVISLGLFVIFLDSTVVNIALPSMVEQFGITLSTASWIINAYTMSVAILLVFMGKIADLAGKKKIYECGLLLFMASSLMCAMAPNVATMLAGRVLQGIGGAMAIPASMTLVRTVVPQEKAGAAMGIWSAVGALAIAAGPGLGGVLTESFGWRSVFYINVPIILAAGLLTRISLRAHADRRTRGRLDMAGTLLLSAGLFGLIHALLQAQDNGRMTGATAAEAAAALILLCFFVWRQRTAREPLIELGIFQDKNYVTGVLSNMLGGILLMGTMIISPLYLTQIKHFTTLKASLILTPMSATLLVAAPFIGKLIDRFGSRRPLFIGYLLAIAGFSAFGLLRSDTPTVWLVLLLTGAGIGIGTIAIASLTLSTSTVPLDKLATASGIFAMFRNLGGALGVVIFISITMTSMNINAPALERDVVQKLDQAEVSETAKASFLQEMKEAGGELGKPAGGDAAAIQEAGAGEAGTMQRIYESERMRYEALGIRNAYLGGAVLSVLFMLSLLLLRKRKREASGSNPIHS